MPPSRLHLEDFYTDPGVEPGFSHDKSDEDPEAESEDEQPLADFEAFARRRPQEDLTHVDFQDDGPGARELDCIRLVGTPRPLR